MKMAKFLVTSLIIILLAIVSEVKYSSSVLSEIESGRGKLDVFTEGNFSTTDFKVPETLRPSSPPKPLLVVTPNVSGTYPVILFLHGTFLCNSFYTDLLQHLSSHGYIVVAPQVLKCLIRVSVFNFVPWLWDWMHSEPEELEYAVKVANWLPSGLKSVLPENVEANLEKIAVAGHSRGGKTAFALALVDSETIFTKTTLEVKISAVIGVDPVAGSSKESRTEPHILSYVPGSFNLTIPVAVIGTGLGNQSNFRSIPKWLMPELWAKSVCAPDEVNHMEFFLESRPPNGHFVTTNYGHLDMLDDHLDDFIGDIMARYMCKNGEGSKDLMRKTVGGIVVAFLKAYFEADSKDYMTILQEPSVAPIMLDPVDFNRTPDHAQVNLDKINTIMTQPKFVLEDEL